MLIARYTMISWRRTGDGLKRKTEWRTNFQGDFQVEEVTHLSEDGHADVVVAGLVDEDGQLVWRYRSGDGFLSRLRRQADRQVLLVRQQIRAGLRRDHNQSEQGSLHASLRSDRYSR